MGSFSVSTSRGLVHWQGLLLAVSLQTFLCLPTITQFAIESNSISEGWDVLLQLRNAPADPQGFIWYRGKGAKDHHIIEATSIAPLRFSQKGPEHRGREKILSDGSLLIRKVTMRDRGMFTVVIYLPNDIEVIGYGRLDVYEPVSGPTLLASNTTVTENTDAVVLTCNTNEVSIRWLFFGDNLQLSERMKLSQDHRYLTIDPVKMEDTGYYQCEVFNPVSFAYSRGFWLDVNHE